MTRERELWEKAKEILYQASLRPPAEQSAFIEASCSGEPILVAELSSLIGREGLSETPLEPLSETVEVDPLEPDAILAERYRVLSRIGEGAMAEIYRVRDLRLDTDVALKRLRITSPVHRQMLVEEVRLARRLSHPGICRVFDLGEADGILYCTMELIEGSDLEFHLRALGRIAPDRVLALAISSAKPWGPRTNTGSSTAT